MAESHDRSSSQEPQLKFPGCSHFRRRSDNHHRCQQCRLNDGLTLCMWESPCDVCRDWFGRGRRLTRLSNRSRSARWWPRRGRMIRWMIPLNCTHLRDRFQAPHIKTKDDGSTQQKNDSVGKDNHLVQDV